MRPSYYCRPWFTRAAAAAMDAPTPPGRAASYRSTSLSASSSPVARASAASLASTPQARRLRRTRSPPAPCRSLSCSRPSSTPRTPRLALLFRRKRCPARQAYTYINRTSHFVKNICSGRTHGRLQTVQRDGCVHAKRSAPGRPRTPCVLDAEARHARLGDGDPTVSGCVGGLVAGHDAEAAFAPGCGLHDGSGLAPGRLPQHGVLRGLHHGRVLQPGGRPGQLSLDGEHVCCCSWLIMESDASLLA
ncbi:uncharacterized protein [Zea mays]|jgi:hypothetical protein|uniref:uncharacterized protein n=1 Tax=Zea mays TaxID=4577 RepID=UPI000C6C7C50|nr:uncharacterized protein LOC111590563 [Zea mays]|eukprot:XP_023157112.1 uncharacterized protein LOC111590563 [Zea mays]